MIVSAGNNFPARVSVRRRFTLFSCYIADAEADCFIRARSPSQWASKRDDWTNYHPSDFFMLTFSPSKLSSCQVICEAEAANTALLRAPHCQYLCIPVAGSRFWLPALKIPTAVP